MAQGLETRPYVPWALMNAFMTEVFMAYGVPAGDAAICADVLLEADRRGIESHGCNRFKPIYLDRIDNGTLLPVTELEVLKETPTTLVMDAHNGMGMVASILSLSGSGLSIRFSCDCFSDGDMLS